jgi:hypothetical protein
MTLSGLWRIRNAIVYATSHLTKDEKPMRIHNIYADENGETHFRDIEIEFSKTGADGTTSKRFSATGIIFRTTPEDWFFDWHPATRRQYVINLDAPHKVTRCPLLALSGHPRAGDQSPLSGVKQTWSGMAVMSADPKRTFATKFQ